MVPERHNAVKVLLFLDVGGSMDDHVRVCEELFSAARAEFKHLEYFYFHNFVYESRVEGQPPALTRDAPRPGTSCAPTATTTSVIFVGDATMSPYEIVQPGGSVEHWNEEPGAVWMKRLLARFPRHVLAQSRAARPLGVHAVGAHHARAGRGPDVPADARRPGPRDAITAVAEKRTSPFSLGRACRPRRPSSRS